MGFQIDNNFNTQQSKFYESHNCSQPQQPTNTTNLQQPSNDFIANFFDFVSKALASHGFSNSNSMGFVNQSFAGSNQPKIEDYGGFKFKNDGEKAEIDTALQELRAEQAANPGKTVSKKFKIGKYRYKVTLDENGELNIRRKKKKRGFFSKIGKAFKKVGGFLKKALPLISTVAMFIPGLQPLALAARIGSGVMGIVDGIKNGNIFGAVTSAFGAMSGIGGKIGSWASNLGSKASGIFGKMGSNIVSKLGRAGTWMQNTLSKGTELLSQGKNWLSTFTGNIGTKVSDFVFGKASVTLENLNNSFGGKFGQLLSQNGSDWLKDFTNSIGRNATNWLNDKANNFLAKLMDNPISRRLRGLPQSPFGRIIINMLRGGRA